MSPSFDIFLLGIAATVANAIDCSTVSLNTTVGLWNVVDTDTIYSIANATDRGVCDIARANSMIDAEYLPTGQTLIIPAQVCDPDQYTCLITGNYTSECILGGPHTYTILDGDTYQKIAQKFQVAVTALTYGNGSIVDPTESPTVAGTLKMPQCTPSQCTVQPYKFYNGTYLDIAAQVNSTVGQIMAFNYGYTHSVSEADGRPVITVPMNCMALSDNITIIS